MPDTLLVRLSRRAPRSWTGPVGTRALAILIVVLTLTGVLSTTPAGASTTTTYASDSFQRSVTGGWGTADVGGPWSSTGAAFAVTPGNATIAANSTAEANFLPSVAAQDVDVTAEITPPPISSTWVDAGLAARYASGAFYQLSVYYAAANNGGNYTLEVKSEPSNTPVASNENTSIPGGTPIWLELQATGVNPTTLQWKIWQAGATEPSTWAGTQVDSTGALQAAGGVGLKAFASSGTETVGFSNFSATSVAQGPPAVTCSQGVVDCDTFSRTSAGGWGTADVGGTWSGTGAAFGVVPGSATLAADPTAPSTFLTSVSAQNVDAEVKISPPPISGSYVDAGMGVRYAGASGSFYQLSVYYAWGNNNSDYTLEVKSEPGDVHLVTDTPTSIPGGTPIWLRLQAVGVRPTTLNWQIWADGSPQPTSWLGSATDGTPALQAAGGVGLKGYSSSGTETVAFNGLLVNPVAGTPPVVASCPSGVVDCDTFNRTLSGQWGNADIGGSWGSTGSAFSVTPGSGEVLADPSDVTNFLTSDPIENVDAVVEISPAPITAQYVDVGVGVRYTAATASFYQLSVYYATGNNGGNYTLEVKTKPSNAEVVPVQNTSIPGGTPIWLELQATGVSPTTLQWRIWAAGSTEPTAWTGTTTDATPGLQGTGGVGVEAYAGGSAPVGVDSLWASQLSSPPPPPPPPGPTTFSCTTGALACDTFGRTVSSGWGTADTGGSWAVDQTPTAWNVSPGSATVTPAPGAEDIATLPSTTTSAENADVLTKLSLPRCGSNGSCDAYVLGRYMGGTSPAYYRVGLVQGPGLSTVQIRTQRSDGSFVRPDVSTGIAAADGLTLWLRVEFQGTNPTAIRARAWVDGTTEPSLWSVATTDTAAAFQGPGGVGIRVRNEDQAASHIFTFEGFGVTQLSPNPASGSGLISDRFDRTVTGGWGNADVGGAWSTSGPGYSVTPGIGTIQADSATEMNFLTATSVGNVQALLWISPPAMTSAYVDEGVAVRYGQAGGTFYQVSAYYSTSNNGGDYTVQLKRKPSNTLIESDYQTDIPGGTGLWILLSAQGTSPTTLSWKVWQDGTAEPSNWMATATDSTAAMQAPGGVGVEAYSNEGTVTASFNSLQVTDGS